LVEEHPELIKDIHPLLKDSSEAVAIVAAEATYKSGKKEEAIAKFRELLNHANDKTVLSTVNSLQLIGTDILGEFKTELTELQKNGSDKYIQRSAEYSLETIQ
jgi:HEAT repeat protein